MSLPFFGKGTYEEPDIKQQPAGRTEAGELPFFGRGVVVEPGGKNKDEEESSLLRRGIVDPAISLLGKGIVGAGETAVGLADIISGGHAGKALSEYAGYNPQATNEFFTSLQSPEYRANLEKMAAAKGVVEKAKVAVTNPSLIASTALESIPSMIGGWGVAKKIAPGLMKKFGPKLGLALAGGVGEGLVTASQNSEQIRQESPDRLLSTKQIALALGSGAATGAIGAVSGRIAQKLGLVDVDTLFIPASKAVGEAIPEAAKGNILKTVISGFLQEGFLEELPQSVQEQMAQNLALDKPITKGLDEAAVMGAFSGGLMGVGGNLIGRPSGSKDKATPGKLSSREQLEMARFRDRVQKDPGNIQNHLNDFLSSKFVRPEIKQEVAAAFGQRGDAAPVSPPLPPAGVAPTTTTGPQAGDQIAPVQPQPGTEIVVPEGNVEAQGIKPGTPEAQALIDETFADIDDNRQSWKTRKEFHFILDNSSNVEEAKELARQMANKNYTDPLMGINNKAAWLESQIDERDTPDDQKAWKAMYDLDNFSWFNDVLGHETGDQVLSKVGEILKETADNPFRFGGEELANIGGNDEAAYNRLLEQSEAIRNKLDNEIKIEFTIPRDIVLDSGEVYKQGDVIVVDGIGVSYGIGRTAKEADGNLISNKAERTGQKLRSKKGYEAQRVYRKVREGELVKGGARPGIESVPQKSELENLPLNEVVVHAQRAGVDFSATDNKADVINAIEGIREEYSSKPAPPTIAAPIKQTPAALPGVKTVTEPSTEAAPASNDTPAPKALDSTTKAETKEPYQKPVSEFLKESSITRNTTDTPTRQGSYYYSYKASKNGEYGDLSSSQGYDTEEEARTVLKRVHRQAVRDAIAADQFVPREVLEEYPDLLPEGMELMDKPGKKATDKKSLPVEPATDTTLATRHREYENAVSALAKDPESKAKKMLVAQTKARLIEAGGEIPKAPEAKKQVIGSAWINNRQYYIYDARTVTRGKNKGKTIVTYLASAGVYKQKAVDTSKVKLEKAKAEVKAETPEPESAKAKKEPKEGSEQTANIINPDEKLTHKKGYREFLVNTVPGSDRAELRRVSGKPVEIKELDADFFIHRQGDQWVLTELKTGMILSRGDTQQEAITKGINFATKSEEAFGRTLQETIEKALKNSGIQANTKEATPSAEQEGDGPSAKRTTPATGMPAAEVESVLSPIISNWQNAPGHYFVQSEDQLPARIRKDIAQYNAQGQIAAVFDRGEVWFVGDNIKDKALAQRAVLHEMIGHYGVESVLKPGQIRMFMMQVAADKKNDEMFLRIAKKYKADLDTGNGKVKAAKEYIAHISEKGDQSKWLDRLVSMIRQAIRKMGITVKVTDAEIRGLIGRGMREVQGKENGVMVYDGTAFQKFADKWYSDLELNLASKLPNKGKGQMMAATIQSWAKKGEFKAEELEWSGLVDWLQEKDTVTKAEVLDWLAENNVRVEEVVKGADGYQYIGKQDGEVYGQGKTEEEARENAIRELEDSFGDEEGFDAESEFDDLAELKENDAVFGPDTHPTMSLPGGKNYKELLITLPDTAQKFTDFVKAKTARLTPRQISDPSLLDKFKKEYEEKYGSITGTDRTYIGSHFPKPNILVHVRFNERTGPNGERVLFLEEVQSDWHQAGRKEGYKEKISLGWKKIGDGPDGLGQYQITGTNRTIRIDAEKRGFYVYEKDGALGRSHETLDAAQRDGEQYAKEAMLTQGVPDAPFKKTWPLLAMKRMMRYAAENGFDVVAWTPGKVQADRYDLAKQVESITLRRTSSDFFKITGVPVDRNATFPAQDSVNINDLENFIGKDLAQKAADIPINKSQTFSGLDLKVGGEGMKGFYDKILPAEVNSFFGKAKWGKAKVGSMAIEDITAHALPITPEMRQKALFEGMPQFMFAGPKAVGAALEYPVIRKDENGNHIVYETKDYRISVNRPGDASTVVLWAKQTVNGRDYWRKAGNLYTDIKTKKFDQDSKPEKYLSISSIEIEKQYRGQGFGKKMYQVLMDHASPEIKGIVSYTPNRVNKKQVPAIYRSLDAIQEGDYQIIPISRKDGGTAASVGEDANVNYIIYNPKRREDSFYNSAMGKKGGFRVNDKNSSAWAIYDNNGNFIESGSGGSAPAEDQLSEWGQAVKKVMNSFVAKLPDNIYIRFGNIPKNEISKHWNGITKEKGVSAYTAKADITTNTVWFGSKSVGGYQEIPAVAFVAVSQGRPIYLVSGDKVGSGSDNEPVLKNVSVIGKLSLHPNKNIDGFVIQHQTDSPSSRYLSLARDPEKNKAELQKMVDEAAKAAGFTVEGWKGYSAYPDTVTGAEKGKRLTVIKREKPFPSFYSGDEGVNIAGFFSNDKDTAERFNVYGEYGAVDRFYLKLGNYKVFDAEGRAAGNVQFGKEGQDFRDAIRSGEYDSIVIMNTSDEGDVFVTLSAYQSKLADPVTYYKADDPEVISGEKQAGDIIPLSERFKEESDDIRYMLTDESNEEAAKRVLEALAKFDKSGKIDKAIKKVDTLDGKQKQRIKMFARLLSDEQRAKIHEKKLAATYALIDSSDPLKQIQGYFNIQDENLDAYQLERLRGKKEAGLIKEFRREVLKPLIERMAKAGIDFGQLDEYRHALHVEEANARLELINAKSVLTDFIDKFGSKDLKKEYEKIREEAKAAKKELKAYEPFNADLEAFDNTETQEQYLALLNSIEAENQEEQDFLDRWNEKRLRLAGLTNEEAADILDKHKGNKEIEAIRKAFADIDDKRLDLLEESGELTVAQVDAMRKAYKNYAPLYREGMDGGLVSGRKIGPLGMPIKTRAGSTKKVVDVSAHTISNYETAISRSLKAETGKTIFELVEKTQTPKSERTDPDKAVWWVEESPKKPGYDKEGNITYYPDMAEPSDGFFVKVKGERKLIRVNTKDPTMKRFLESVKQAPEQNGIVRALSSINRYLAAVNTSLSPEFILSNLSRDLQTAAIHIEDTEVKGMQVKILKQLPKAIKGIWKAERSGSKDGMSGWYRDFEKNGGKIGWMSGYEEMKDISKRLQSELDEASGKSKGMAAAKSLMGIIESANTAIENGVRLATYKTMVDAGHSRQKAASVASNLTVDFTKKGKYGGTVNAFYLFSNAGIQGNVRIIQALGRSPKVRKIVGGIIASGFAMNILGLMMGGDDDDGIPYYDKLRESDPALFERNIVIMIGDKGKHAKIPMPWGYNAFYNLGHEASNATYKLASGDKYDPRKGAARVISGFANSFNPLSSATLLQTLAPTVLDPIAVVNENVNWHGGPLMPERNAFEKIPKPDSERFFKSVSKPSKFIAQTLNNLTGGDTIKPGIIDLSPETLDLLYDTATGSMGRFVRNTALLPFAEEPSQVPFVRRFYGRKSEYVDNQIYYDMVKDVLTVKEQIEAGSETLRNPMARYIPLATQTEKELRRLHKIKKRAEANGANTDLIKKRIEAVQKNFLRTINEKQKRAN